LKPGCSYVIHVSHPDDEESDENNEINTVAGKIIITLYNLNSTNLQEEPSNL